MNGNFKYLHEIKDKEMLDSLVDMLLMFFQCFLRPQSIVEDLSPILKIEGALTQNDQTILLAWCDAIIAIETNMIEVFELSNPENRERFESEKDIEKVLLLNEAIEILKSFKQLLKSNNP